MRRDRSSWTSPLIENGWNLESSCVCGGVYREDWVNPINKGFMVNIYPDGTGVRGPAFTVRFYQLQKLKEPLHKLNTILTTYDKFKKN